jgi:hypothetical protein
LLAILTKKVRTRRSFKHPNAASRGHLLQTNHKQTAQPSTISSGAFSTPIPLLLSKSSMAELKAEGVRDALNAIALNNNGTKIFFYERVSRSIIQLDTSDGARKVLKLEKDLQRQRWLCCMSFLFGKFYPIV